MKVWSPSHLPHASRWVSFLLFTVMLACILWSANLEWDLPVEQLALSLGAGLFLALAASRQPHRSYLRGQALAGGLGLLLVWSQVDVAFFKGQPPAMAQFLWRWLGLVLSGRLEGSPELFSFVALLLGITLAYGGAWCVIRAGARWHWPMLATYTVVFLCLLYPQWNANIPIFIIFVLASLLLSLHVHLDVSRRDCALSETVCLAHAKKAMARLGGIIAVGIILLAWFLPAGYVNPTAAKLLSQAQQDLKVLPGQKLSPLFSSYPFADALSFAGPPQLSSNVVATVQSSSPGVYLQVRWYDTYTGAFWMNRETTYQSYQAEQTTFSQTLMTYPLRQTITIVTPPLENYLLGAPGISAVNLPTTVLKNIWDGEPVEWFAQSADLSVGSQYTVISSVSVANAAALRSVPEPEESGPNAAPDPTESIEMLPFLQLPVRLDPRIPQLARQITAGMPTMYDKAMALQTYLRTNYTYNLQVKLPAGKEAVSWFLFDSGHQGYCTYFATAMAILARSLGIPARVVTGYAPGTYNAALHQQVIRGTDAHSWTQIYFAGYGWVNFEPTSGFTTLRRAPLNLASSEIKSAVRKYGSSAQPGYGTLEAVICSLSGILLAFLLLCLLWLQRLRPRTQASELYRCVCLLATLAGKAPRPSQTPEEYTRQLLHAMPYAHEALERMCSLYVRERWALPASPDHPASTGELQEVPDLWRQLKPSCVKSILRHWCRQVRFR